MAKLNRSRRTENYLGFIGFLAAANGLVFAAETPLWVFVIALVVSTLLAIAVRLIIKRDSVDMADQPSGGSE